MCLLFYGIKSSDQPFAASLLGIRARAQDGEELQLSSQISFADSELINNKHPLHTMPCNTAPNPYLLPTTSTPTPRTRRSWLPPLRFQLPDENEHSLLQSTFPRPSFKRQPTPRSRRSWLLPPLRFQLSDEQEHPALRSSPHRPPSKRQPSARARGSWLLPPLKFQRLGEHDDEREHEQSALQSFFQRPSSRRRSTPILSSVVNQRSTAYSHTLTTFDELTRDPSTPRARALSSVYSPATSVTDLSRNPSTFSSLSNNSRDSSYLIFPKVSKERIFEPEVPTIPERYRHPCHSVRNGGQPVRPGSSPAMPPAGFWMHAKPEQQKYSEVPDTPPKTSWPIERPTRPRTSSSSPPRHSLPAAPNKALLSANVNKGNRMRAEKRSYESVRKDSLSGTDSIQSPSPSERRKKRDSRTLVKKRQPWDGEPRVDRRGYKPFP